MYKDPTVAASKVCTLNDFAYLEKVDKISMNSGRHLYCGDIIIQSKVVHIDSPTSTNSKIIDLSTNYTSSKFIFTTWSNFRKSLRSYL